MSLYESLTRILAPYASRLNGLLTGYDGTEYSTPGEAVRSQISDLHVLIGDEPGTAIAGSAVGYDGSESGLTATNMQGAVDELSSDISNTNERLGNLESIKSASIMDGVAWARGTIYPDTGKNGASTTRIRTVDYMDMTGIERISVSINSGYKYALFWYNNENTFIKLYNSGVYKTEEQVIDIPADVAYMRICVADVSDGTASVDYADELSVGVYSDVVNTILTLGERTTNVEGRTSVYDTALAVENRLIANTESDWEQGTINVNTGADADETTAIRTDYIAVYSFENINVSVESGYKYCVLFYDSVKGYMKAESLTAYRTSPVEIGIPDGACYVRVKIASTTSSVVVTQSDYANISLYLQPKLFGRLAEGDREDVVVVQRHKKQEAYSFKFRRTGSASYDNCDLLMMFITDIHQHWNMCERTKQLVNNWGSDYVDMVVCGGDIPKVYGTENVDSYFTTFSDLSVPLLNVVGNHEYLTSGGDQTREAVYAKFIAPIVPTADIVQPAGASTNGLNYYYKDHGTVRLIAIDCMSWDADQLAWFEGVLADARTNSKHVLCVSHCPFPDNIMTLVECLWSKSVFTILDQHKTSAEAAQAVKTFMDNGGTFVGWIIGHLHADLIFKLADYGNQFVFTLSAFHSLYSSIIKSKDKADYNYDSMTYIAVDTMHNIIKLLRIGADIDVTGTKHNGLSVNYATKTVISDW